MRIAHGIKPFQWLNSITTTTYSALTRHNNINILMDNVKVTWSSLSKSLAPKGVVYFLKNWEGAGREEDYKNCARQAFAYAWNKRLLHYYDLLIFPCLYNNHWFVFTVDIKGQHFVFLDSMYGENHGYQKNVQRLLEPARADGVSSRARREDEAARLAAPEP
uniref:Ubiquitin-like protease family profile domain-containing protein n=1 Tax=Oryza punctata TaxID=4537 RepID=A0A0E0LTQ7_ORYPU